MGSVIRWLVWSGLFFGFLTKIAVCFENLDDFSGLAFLHNVVALCKFPCDQFASARMLFQEIRTVKCSGSVSNMVFDEKKNNDCWCLYFLFKNPRI